MCLVLLWINVIAIYWWLEATLCSLFLPKLSCLFLEPSRCLTELFVGRRRRLISVSLVVNFVGVCLLTGHVVVIVAINFLVV